MRTFVIALIALGGALLAAGCTGQALPPVGEASQRFSLEGSVTGLQGSGLVLELNGQFALPTPANGKFRFAQTLGSGTSYSVTVAAQPTAPSQTCTVSQGSGTVQGANVTGISVSCTTNLYVIGGTVVGLAGSGLVLQDNGGDDLSVSADGSFTFATAVASGTTFSVAVSAQPSSPSQTCTVSGGSGTVAGSDVSSVTVNCTTNPYVVGGTVSGLAGTGLQLSLNGGTPLAINSAGSFAFPAPLDSGSPYTVTIVGQPTSPWQTCVLSGETGTVTNGPVTSVQVSCTTNPYSVSGTVSGLAGSGLVLQDNAGDDLPISADGSFSFPTKVASGGSYAVTVSAQPTSPWQTCTVSQGSGTVGGSNVTSVLVNCVTNTYALAGTVNGLSGSGLVVQNNGGDDLAISRSGSFAFATPVASGAGYSVTVKSQPTSPWQTCTVANGSGTITNADVTDVAVSCVTNSYNVKVSVSGLSGTGLVVQNNGGDNLSVTADGTYTFASPAVSGATYDVTVLSQPTSPWQTCTVASPTGTVGGSDATVAVSCVSNPYTVGGTVSGLSGSGLVLRNNGADDLAIAADGSFTFATPVASGASYDVTVKGEPLGEYCSVANGTGTIGNSAVTDVSVTCVATPCSASVLVLGSANDGPLVTALTNAGMSAQLFGDPSAYSGTPAASGFGAVIVMPDDDNNYSVDMPAAGQQSIVSSTQTGTGVVFTEWSSFELLYSHYTSLAPLMLFARESGERGTPTWTVASGQTDHPLWAGLPSTFTSTDLGLNVATTPSAGATVLASVTCSNGVCSSATGVIGEAYKDGTTRTVQIAHSSTFGGYAPWSDANIVTQMVNAAKWAAHCQ